MTEVQPGIEKHVLPLWMLHRREITGFVPNDSEQLTLSSVTQGLKSYAPWQHTINHWIHPTILSKVFYDGNPPFVYRNNPSPTSFVYVKVDEGSVARFVFNGFLTLDPGKKKYAGNINHLRGAFELATSVDPT